MTTTLLAVDDSVTMRKVLEITFAGENFKTVLVSSGAEALNALKSERPAIALVDHTLADMSGYDLCREMKAAVPGLAVLVLASKQSPFDKAKGTASGVDDFMDKPFDTQKLLDKVNQVIAAPRATATAAAAAPAPQVHAPAPAAAAPIPTAAARPRSQTLSYGTPAGGAAQTPSPVAAAARPQAAPAPAPATPKPGIAAAAPRLAAQQPAPVAVAPTPKPAPAAAPVVAAVASATNGALTHKLEGLGLTPAQVEAVLSLSREIVEKVVWEVVPVLAETIIKEEIKRLTE